MRQSNIAVTMNTYTDSRLLDTAAAVEAITVLRKLAPTTAEMGTQEPVTVDPADRTQSTDKRENPTETKDSCEVVIEWAILDSNQRPQRCQRCEPIQITQQNQSKTQLLKLRCTNRCTWKHLPTS